MVCPNNSWFRMCGNFNCEWVEVTTTEETTRQSASDISEEAGSSGGAAPITTQPTKITKVEKRVQFNTAQGDESTIHMIQEAGELVDSILSHRRTQGCTEYCYDSYATGCGQRCGSFGRLICGTYKACCLDREDNQVAGLVHECEQTHGPIAVALAAKTMGLNLMELVEKNTILSEEQKNEFRQHCSEAKTQLYGTMQSLSQNFFLEGVNSIRERGLDDSLVQAVLSFIATRSWEKTIESEEASGTSSASNSTRIPACYILNTSPLTTSRLSCGSRDARRPSSVGAEPQYVAKKYNDNGMARQLGKIQVTNLKTGDFSALGPFGLLIVKMLNSFLLSASQSTSSILKHTGGEICYTCPNFRDIVVLLMLAIGYCPANTDETSVVDIHMIDDPIMTIFYRLQYSYRTGKTSASFLKKKPSLVRQESLDCPTPAESVPLMSSLEEEDENEDDDEDGNLAYQQRILECSGHLQTLFLGIKINKE
ncbi:hypothetical protein CpB1116 [Chlamydia pneumoniae TW-183]|uniref:Uncharacterized protein n=3 Tax=Chlamydia pneumoniae TaxID=83558 RepID=Q9Z6I8_CHLPN|nr:hypothetical protein [Chlamydia pneumoniae]AAD19208.1 hypothetical protein CPn_1071 [Chlamydia pneumoniae CWL029]AAF38578.1 hypothetical protein CP_0779 [Chlamydia pneumoniae AR39]AAP99044.1 hypothetical protein CpB1116 [Chlamydia pneumoniae TW-183]CRI33614.1 Uncharacterized protein BN1224_Wien1_A_11210 [Chlamydia pneumoniae]CRI36479.1 Uncharacterized protein BN1224_CM1_A_11260 [Chlamydia pneumoniae]